MIKRYSIGIGYGLSDPAEMEESQTGEWVKYEDHLQAVEDALDDVAYDLMVQERLRD